MLDSSLAGITVLSMAEQYPGPLCTRLLLELGAEVILLERPGKGDPQRKAGPWLFRCTAAGKQSIALDLKIPRARDAARLLAEKAQVFVEGFRPGVMKRLGLDYETLRQANPALVYCSISGYGQDGPYRDASSHNINYEAITGALDPYVGDALGLTYFPGGLPMGDIMAGMTSALGIAASVRQAERTGQGAYLDIAISDALVFSLAPNLCGKINGGRGWPKREAGYGLYRTADGHVVLGIAHEDDFWRALCTIAELPALASLTHAERVERNDELRHVVQARLLQRETQYWLDRFAASSVPCSRVNRLDEAPRDPQLAGRGLFGTALDERGREFMTVRSPFSRTRPSGDALQVPPLGASTAHVLRRLGFGEAEVAALTTSAADEPE